MSVQNRYEMPLLVEDIQKILPHRYPFLMLDRIVEFEDRQRIVGLKNVSVNEPFFQGHFPSRPIMPGVLILEAMAQLGALFAHISTDGVPLDKLIVFAGADKVRFRRPVVPGDALRIELDRFRLKFGTLKMDGRVRVGDEIVAEAELTAAQI